MGILDAIQTGLAELFSHKLRSMLTMLGVIFGVAAVIAMVSIGEGARQEMLQQIKSMGIDIVQVRRVMITGELMETAQKKSPYGLKYSDAEGISSVCTYARRIVPVREIFADIKRGDKPLPVQVVGTTPDYSSILKLQLQSGRFLNEGDLKERSCVCVLGSNARKQLFGFEDPTGRTVKVGMRLLRVVGVLEYKEKSESRAFSSLRDVNSDIYMPLSIAMTDYMIQSQQQMPMTYRGVRDLFMKMITRTSLDKSPISEIIVQLKDESATEATAEVIRSILNRAHRDVPDFEIVVPSLLLRQSQQAQRIFNIVMAAIAGISLLVGGIGIMNIMLATVSQRTREIGVRRCIGATRWDIVRQFMLEAMVITCLGGLIGVLLGVVGARVISVFAGWITVVSVRAIILSFGVSALVGIVFGLYPATRAAMVDPIDALRQG
ncbi:MAG: ABC transporter permease [bacterium]|nr:ABC transporter permease [bacterium]